MLVSTLAYRSILKTEVKYSPKTSHDFEWTTQHCIQKDLFMNRIKQTCNFLYSIRIPNIKIYMFSIHGDEASPQSDRSFLPAIHSFYALYAKNMWKLQYTSQAYAAVADWLIVKALTSGCFINVEYGKLFPI
jgi:hypothetical protein